MKEVRPRKHTCVSSEERTDLRCAVLTRKEVRAPLASALQRAAGAGLLT